MTAKSNFLLLPAIALPYVGLAALLMVLSSGKHPYIMNTVFGGNAWNLIVALAVYALIALALSLVFFGLSFKNRAAAISLAGTAMLIKLVQIPAYLAVFAFGLLFLLSVFTAAFVPVLVLLDCLSLFSSGLVSLAAVIAASREQAMPMSKCLWLAVLQFVFCADVFAAIILYRKLHRLPTAPPSSL